jgi:hypothetical protein
MSVQQVEYHIASQSQSHCISLPVDSLMAKNRLPQTAEERYGRMKLSMMGVSMVSSWQVRDKVRLIQISENNIN